MDKLSREEVKELVEKISYGMGSDEEVSEWIQKIMDSVPNICKLLCEHHNGYLKIENTASGAKVSAYFKSPAL